MADEGAPQFSGSGYIWPKQATGIELWILASQNSNKIASFYSGVLSRISIRRSPKYASLNLCWEPGPYTAYMADRSAFLRTSRVVDRTRTMADQMHPSTRHPAQHENTTSSERHQHQQAPPGSQTDRTLNSTQRDTVLKTQRAQTSIAKSSYRSPSDSSSHQDPNIKDGSDRIRDPIDRQTNTKTWAMQPHGYEYGVRNPQPGNDFIGSFRQRQHQVPDSRAGPEANDPTTTTRRISTSSPMSQHLNLIGVGAWAEDSSRQSRR